MGQMVICKSRCSVYFLDNKRSMGLLSAIVQRMVMTAMKIAGIDSAVDRRRRNVQRNSPGGGGNA